MTDLQRLEDVLPDVWADFEPALRVRMVSAVAGSCGHCDNHHLEAVLADGSRISILTGDRETSEAYLRGALLHGPMGGST